MKEKKMNLDWELILKQVRGDMIYAIPIFAVGTLIFLIILVKMRKSHKEEDIADVTYKKFIRTLSIFFYLVFVAVVLTQVGRRIFLVIKDCG
jgi:hypothetical protein